MTKHKWYDTNADDRFDVFVLQPYMKQLTCECGQTQGQVDSILSEKPFYD